ncbi:MAG: hypothetical protein FWC60_08810 [Firmicutes bacterium]|nr:hypothetical protein [Bacillota bacterium]
MKFKSILFYWLIVIAGMALYLIIVIFVFAAIVTIYCSTTGDSPDLFLGWLVPLLLFIIISEIIILFYSLYAMLQIIKDKKRSIPLIGKIAQKVIRI